MVELKTLMPGVVEIPIHRKSGRYYPERLSKGKREDYLRFLSALYSSTGSPRDGVNKLTPAKTVPSKTQDKPISTIAFQFRYVDKNGVEQVIDTAKVANLGDTTYAESKKLYPNAEQCMIDKSALKFDSEGRENVINTNLLIVEATRMTKGDYGPWFLLRCGHPVKGEISVPAPGVIANEAIQSMSGIALKDGSQIGASELPVWARFEFVPKAGQFGSGYFVILPALEELPASQDD